ncbi:MAG: SIMPL domain-containing protein [Caldimicrobium sp.]|nr:SIMPL domain-containing protein [Caldimicrobium sp.]MCX7612661.1 SIMPL domain-containing protein [Caldimicrobium sp.]MDW8182186.1 SIMPL domain-containing protein [Caldimicrobium sp.]
MKILIGITLLLIFFISDLNAQERVPEDKVTRIYLTFEQKVDIQPDLLQMNLHLTSKADKEAEVVNALGDIDKAIRALGIDYSGGKYSVEKNCFYEKNKWKCVGYIGNLHYYFKLTNPKEQNKILEAIESVKEKLGDKVEYSVDQPQWVVTEKQTKRLEKNLQMDLISQAAEFAKEVGEKIGRKCSIFSIDFDMSRGILLYSPVFLKSAERRAAPSIEAPEPKKDDKVINVKAKVNMICVEHQNKY